MVLTEFYRDREMAAKIIESKVTGTAIPDEDYIQQTIVKEGDIDYGAVESLITTEQHHPDIPHEPGIDDEFHDANSGSETEQEEQYLQASPSGLPLTGLNLFHVFSEYA